jgi:tetratricopeptide (TPR) repeat protein
MTANIVSLPVHYGPAVPPKVKRRVRYKRQPLATIAMMADHPQGMTPRERASAIYHRAIEVDDANPSYGEAMYREALDIDPTYTIARTNLGNCLFNLGRHSEARAEYEKAVQCDPHQPEALYNLGYMMLNAGNAFGAVSLIKRALVADPYFADAWYNLGEALGQSLGYDTLPVRHAFGKYLALTAGATGALELQWRGLAQERIAR